MRVNSRVFTERMDMLDGIQVPNCPPQFKLIAENIMNMVSKPGYSIGKYHTMTELDKILMLNYWEEYDGMLFLPPHDDELIGEDYRNWFIHKATAPELIRRARQWLSEHNYLLINPNVSERAYEAGSKFSRAIKS